MIETNLKKKKKTRMSLVIALLMIVFTTFQMSAQEEEEEGPEAPPAPIEDWIPAMAVVGVAFGAYVLSKEKTAEV